MAKNEITWYAPEFKYHHKELGWYWLSIIGSGVLFLISLWQKNLLFGIFVIIAELMVIIWAKEFPKNIRFKLSGKGLEIGKMKSYSYEELDGFHIHEEDEDGFSELIFKCDAVLLRAGAPMRSLLRKAFAPLPPAAVLLCFVVS